MKQGANFGDISEKQREFYRNTIRGININNSQPGSGKTYNFVEEVEANQDKRYIFFTPIHAHLTKVEKRLKKDKGIACIHWEGFERLCLRHPGKNKKPCTPDEKFVYHLYKTFPKGARMLCPTCHNKKSCQYHNQFRKKNVRVVLAPLEFLFLEAIKTGFDRYFVDECVKKLNLLKWSFSATKLLNYIDILEKVENNPIPLIRKYVEKFLILHKEIMKQMSIIFSRPENEVLGFDSKTYSGEGWVKKGFLQKRDVVTHWGKMSIPLDSNFGLLFDGKARNALLNQIQHIIREAIQKKVMVDEIIENYSPIEEWFDFLEVMLLGYLQRAVIVSERIEIRNAWNLSKNEIDYIEIVEETKKWRKGFISTDKPFLHDKNDEKYIISNIGWEYSQEKTGEKKDSWLTVGFPFIYLVFELAEKNHVVILDATFNNTLFKEDKALYENGKSFTHGFQGKKSVLNLPIPTKNIDIPRIKSKSVLYKVGKANYPKRTLEERLDIVKNEIKKLVSFIKAKVGVIVPKDYESRFKSIADETLHYFGLRGKNMDVSHLFLVGTPYIPPYQIPFEYVLKFGKIPSNVEIIKDKEGRFVGYEDSLLNELFKPMFNSI